MSLLSPSSIAVIGASSTPGKVGHDVLKNLLEQGYKGDVYPVNPKGGEILDAKAYTSIGEIPSAPEMAIIITPAPTVPGILEECAAAGTLQAVIISAGFKETNTDEGKRLEAEVARIAHEKEMIVIGPNCLGMLRPSSGMNASFAKDVPPAGGIALVSQSGAFAVAILDAAPALRMGFSSVVSIGNKAVTDECDLLELLGDDAETTVIGLYLESIVDGRRFRDVAARVSRKKPVVLLKAGVSSFGRRAAASHTGALAGSDGAVDAVCRQAGIRRAHDLEEFTDVLRALSVQPVLASLRIAVVTNAGGPGILAADAAERCGLTLPPLADSTIATLTTSLPPAAGLNNPVDVVGDAGADRYGAAIQACMRDPNVDGLIVLLTPQVMTPCAEVARIVAGAAKKSKLLPVVTAFMGGESVCEAIEVLADAGIPNFATPERAIRAMAGLTQVGGNDRRTEGIRNSELGNIDRDRQRKAAGIIGDANGLLSEDQTAELFALYDIPVPQHRLADSATQAAAMAKEIGFPVVAKVSSPDIIHKTDVGGIRIGLSDAAAVRDAYTEIETNVRSRMPNARWNGVLVQQQLPAGDECIVGGVRDPSFGPLVMAGLGGIFTELFRDTGLRLAPLKEEDAYALLSELKSWAMLLGMRGRSPRDIPALARILVAIGDLLVECPRITELDCNPVILGEDGVMVADGKVIVGE